MTLIELVRLINNAQNLSTSAVSDQTLDTFRSINAALAHGVFDRDIDAINYKQQQIVELLQSVDSDLTNICKKLQYQIDQFADECHEKSLYIYNNSVQYDDPEYLFEKNTQYLNVAPESNKQALIEKVKTKIDWRYPAMEIRPNNMYVTKDLVACDPLYLVDTNDNMFSKCREAWNNIYQRRVRYYTIDEQATEMLCQLPTNQFGLIVTVDFFDHRPLDLIQRYLTEIYNKLRPGGTAIFTFNDCDYPEGVENFNNIYYCYTPGHTIIEYCNTIGYIVKERLRLNGASSYLEIQKPGTLTTIRAGQTLGKIIDI